MKQQFVVTHTIRQNEIPPLQDSSVTNTPAVQMLLTHTHTQSFSSYFRENETCFRVGILRVGQSPQPCTIMTYCCFTNDMCFWH